jgi:hypothetical protein
MASGLVDWKDTNEVACWDYKMVAPTVEWKVD